MIMIIKAMRPTESPTGKSAFMGIITKQRDSNKAREHIAMLDEDGNLCRMSFGLAMLLGIDPGTLNQTSHGAFHNYFPQHRSIRHSLATEEDGSTDDFATRVSTRISIRRSVSPSNRASARP
jgi:hypothetical protein